MLRMEFFDFKCSYCGGPFEEVDHAIPLSRGGSNWPANLRPACKSCNRRKFTKTIWEFRELLAA
jgi:5-methylcytosine-specific restriction endonuclease McrA